MNNELRAMLGLVLNALDRDAAEGKAARGEMAAELRAVIAKQIPEQGKQTYLIGYAHACGSGRCIETFNGKPTEKEIKALENEIERRADLLSVGIMSISSISNSDAMAMAALESSRRL